MPADFIYSAAALSPIRGSQRTEILDRFEPLMGDKAATE